MFKISTILVFFMISQTESINYTQPNFGCGYGWNGVERPTGRWCLKVFNGTMTQSEAENKCNTFDSSLSGFMNADEQKIVNDDAMTILPQVPGSIWLGLERTAACLTSLITPQCTAENSFYYTDGSTTGTGGLVWDYSESQPDNAWTGTQACVIFLVAPTSGEPIKHGNWWWLTQKLDDVQCNLESNYAGPRNIVGFLCGKPAY